MNKLTAEDITTKEDKLKTLLLNSVIVDRELCVRSFYYFFRYFWHEVSNEEFIDNWHIEYLCNELQIVAERAGSNKPKLYDLVINVPPGSSKTTMVMIMYPVWCWVRYFHLKFITASYSNALSYESSDSSRDLINSESFQALFPDVKIIKDKNTKGLYYISKLVTYNYKQKPRRQKGGSRYTTSVTGTLTGFHGHLLLVDDPIDVRRSFSDTEIRNVSNWIQKTLPTRKINKEVSVTILIMQRLHEDDPAGILQKNEDVKVISIPGELGIKKSNGKYEYEDNVKPKTLIKHYQDGLMDSRRLSRKVLDKLLKSLGQHSYNRQIGQKITGNEGSLFHVHKYQIVKHVTDADIIKLVRYWDKAATEDGGAYTSGCLIAMLRNGMFAILDIVRGQYATNKREDVIKATCWADYYRYNEYIKNISFGIEQEPGSGGKDSALMTIKNLAGLDVTADIARGDKTKRATPLSVQVNNGNVFVIDADWNKAFINECKYFPASRYKDMVDSASGGFNMLFKNKIAKSY